MKQAVASNIAVAIGLTIVILLANIIAADAQMIETDFPSDIPGYAPNLSASVINRMLMQGINNGINADGFVIDPQASESTGYNSEALGTSGSGSFYNSTQASISVNSDGTNGNFDASASVNNQIYWRLPEANTTNWNVGLGTSFDIGNDVATLSYAHTASNLRATDIGVFGVITPVPYVVDDVRLSYDKDLARFSLTPLVEYRSDQFGQSAGRNSISYKTLSNQIETGGLTGRFEFSPGDGAVAIIKTSRAQYASEPLNDYDDYSGFVGLDFRGPSIIQVRLLVGAETRRFINNPGESITVPTFELDGVWTPTELDTVTASGFRELQNATSPFVFNQIETIGQIELDHELRQNVFLRADGQFGLTQEQSNIAGLSGEQQTLFYFGFATVWNINQNMRINVSYSHSADMPQDVSGAVGANRFTKFNNQSITIGVTAFE